MTKRKSPARGPGRKGNPERAEIVEKAYLQLQQQTSDFMLMLDGQQIPRFDGARGLTLLERMSLWRTWSQAKLTSSI